MGGRAPAPFVGRDAERRELGAALGLPWPVAPLVVVEGEAGVGKTRLLDAVVPGVRGVRVLRGAAVQSEGDRPFAALADALDLRREAADPARAALARLLGDAGEPAAATPFGAPSVRQQVVGGTVALLEDLAAAGPVLVVLDDGHWADPATLGALTEAVRALRDVPVGLLVTCRPSPRAPELERLLSAVAQRGGRALALAPLPGADVAELARAVCGGTPGPRLSRVLAAAGGNPLHVTELLTTLADAGELAGDDGVVDTPGDDVPPTLHRTLLRRLGVLSPGTLDVVQVAAVLGAAFSPTDVATVLGRPVTDVLPALVEALATGVVRDAGDRLAFSHDLVHEAVHAALPRAVRAALHLQAGRALAAAGAPAAQVAHHLAVGAPAGDDEALGWLRRAAREAAPREPGTAVGLLRRAHALAVRPADRAAVAGELAWALLWSGRLDEVEALAAAVLATRPPPQVAGSLHYARAKARIAQGRVAESLADLEVGVAIPGLPGDVLARLLGDLALRRYHARDLAGAREAATRARAAAEGSGCRFAACAAACALSVVATAEGRTAEAARWADEAAAVADADPTGEAQLVGPRLYQGLQRVAAGDLDEVEALLAAGRQGDGSAVFATHYGGLEAFLAWARGDWDTAVVEAETCLDPSDAERSRAFDVRLLAVLARVALHRDDTAAADAALAEARAATSSSGWGRLGWEELQLAEALRADVAGRPADGARVLAAALAALRDAGFLAEAAGLAPELLRRAALLPDGDGLAASALAVADEVARRSGTPVARGAAARCRALAARDPQEACRAALDAVGVLRGATAPLDLASACEDAARALQAAGRTTEAVAHLEEAFSVLTGLGAARDAARVEAALRDLGVRRGRRGPRRRPTSGWESLTPTEVEVVRLVRDGLTNREVGARLYVSHRTVATHLSHVFAKLGVSTRVELVAAAVTRDARAG